MRFPLSIVLVVAAASQVGATDCGQITRDQGFDLWCGDKLCYWDLERGAIKKVGSWNKSDSAVEMIGDDTAFAQNTDVTSSDTSCIRFEMIANVEESAEVRLNVDVFRDGTVDYSERIPTSKWKPLSFLIPIHGPYYGVRFEMTKRGSGRGVVAQLQAEVGKAGECDGLTPIEIPPAANGAMCLTNNQCQSGTCSGASLPFFEDPIPGVCSAVCGYGDSCVGMNSKELGEQCDGEDECESGVCTEHVCSTCGPSDPCTSEACAPAYLHGPSLCAPGNHVRGAAEPCATNADCISNSCLSAEHRQCPDGRRPGECLSTGIQGGRCE